MAYPYNIAYIIWVINNNILLIIQVKTNNKCSIIPFADYSTCPKLYVSSYIVLLRGLDTHLLTNTINTHLPLILFFLSLLRANIFYLSCVALFSLFVVFIAIQNYIKFLYSTLRGLDKKKH